MKLLKSSTSPLGGIMSMTAPLARGLRPKTVPFDLSEVDSPAPGTFRQERFTPKSKIRKLGALEIELIEHPCETLHDAIPQLMAELNRLAAEFSPFRPGEMMHHHLEHASVLMVIRENGIPKGFSITSDVEIEGFHYLMLNATVFCPSIRGNNLFMGINKFSFLRTALKRFPRKFFVAGRTQNPIVYGTFISSAPFHPRPDRPAPEIVRAAARALSRTYRGEYDNESMVMRGSVTVDPGDVHPRHRDPVIGAFIERHLDQDAGDCFLTVAHMGLWDVARLFHTLRRKRKRNE